MGVVFGAYLVVQSCLAFYQKRTILNKYTVILFLTLRGFIIVYINNPQVYSFYSKKDLIAFDHARWRYLQAIVSDYTSIILAYGLIVFGFIFEIVSFAVSPLFRGPQKSGAQSALG